MPKDRSQLRLIIGVSVITGLVVIAHLIGWLTPIERLFRSITNKGSQAVYTLSIQVHDASETFDSVGELQAAYQTTKEALLDTQVDATRLQLLEDENQELKARLGYMMSSTYQTIGAQVIGKNIEPLANTIVIDRGAADGIAVGNPVIVDDGIIVGKVSRVEEHTAIIRLLTDSQSRVGATIVNRDKSLGIIEGGYAISVRMTLIPQNEIINLGDAIITSGLESGTPRGLYIGTITSVQKETYQSFQEAIVQPAIDSNKLHTVGVLITS